MTRIVLADDHAIFREGLASLLSGQSGLTVIGQCGDGDGLWELISRERPDVAIADLSMPGQGVADICKAVAERGWPTRILVLTMHQSPDLARHLLQQGVHGFVLKKNAFDELLTAIEQVQQGKTFVSPAISTDVLKRRPNKPELLTPREVEIIRLIAAGHTNERIGRTLDISTKTVQTHRARAMEKLRVHSAAELVKKTVELGLIAP